MPPVLDVIGGLFKRQVLSTPQNIEVTYRCGRVTTMGEAVNGNLRGGLGSNRVGYEPACSLEALGYLRLTADHDEIDRITGCPRGCPGETGQGGEVYRVGIQPDEQYTGKQ